VTELPLINNRSFHKTGKINEIMKARLKERELEREVERKGEKKRMSKTDTERNKRAKIK